MTRTRPDSASASGGHIIDIHDGRADERVGPAPRRARESARPSPINVWMDPDVSAPGTKNQTMCR